MEPRKAIEQAIRVARLDTEIYEAVEEDPGASLQAGLIVAVALAAAGVGSIHSGQPLLTFLVGLAVAGLGWALWMGIIWGVANYILTESTTQASYAGFARTVGCAAVPGAALIVAILPGALGGLLFLAVSGWWLATTTLAVRQSLYYGDLIRSAIVVGVGWVAQIILLRVFVFHALLGTVA